MKTLQHIAFTTLFILATAPSLRAEFLVLQVRENTARQIWILLAICTALLVVFTMKNSRSKGGQGR